MTAPATPSNAGSPNVGEGLVPVIQDDRERAISLLGAANFPALAERWRSGLADDDLYIQTLARHRIVHTRATSHTVPAIPVDRLREALEPVFHWYQSDEHDERPLLDIVADVVADLQVDRAAALKLAASPAYTPRPVEGEVGAREWLRGDWYERWQDATENADEGLMATLDALRGRVERTILAALARPVEAGAVMLAEVEEAFNDIANEHGVQGYGRDTPAMKAVTAALAELMPRVIAALTTPAGGIAAPDREGGR